MLGHVWLHRAFRIGFCALLAFATIPLSGCKQSVDLDAVRKLAATAASSQDAFDSVAQDEIDACQRINRWNQLDAVIVGRLLELHPKAKATRPTFPPALDCAAVHAKAVARWKATNALYLGYFAALGKIAGTGSNASAYGFKDFATALKNAGALKDDAQAGHLSDLSSGIVDQFLNARRQNSIAKFAGPDGPGAKYVDELADALIKAATIHDSTRVLESGSIDAYYRAGLQFMTTMSDVSSIDQYFHSWSNELDPVAKRHSAIAAYINSVNNLRAAHAAMAKAIGNNSLEAAVTVVSSYADMLSSDVAQINKAFTPTPSGGK